MFIGNEQPLPVTGQTMLQMNIILTGFMGTGKSTVGRALAGHLGTTFIDTDQLIEERANCRITDIFARQGEDIFRCMEAEIAQELAAQHGLVIATGGGFFTNPENIKLLQQHGRILCLTATAEDILNRVQKQRHIRPLLQHPNPLERIKYLLQEREPVYRRFPQITTSSQTVDQVVDTIINLLTPDS